MSVQRFPCAVDSDLDYDHPSEDQERADDEHDVRSVLLPRALRLDRHVC
jgi:hypothetical protein